MKKFLATLLIVCSLFFASTVNAEVKTYSGVGEYLMSDFETFDVAQQRAKQRAEQNACEQAGVYVESRTEVQNAQVTKDEIITITSSILKIVDVQFKREFVDDNTTRIRATVQAQIDSEDINKWLAKGAQERATLVAQNEALRRANAEQDKQIVELKQQLADVKTQADKDRITQQVSAEDKIFLSNQKFDSAGKFYEQKDFNTVIALCTQAIELNPDSSSAYHGRGIAYANLGQYKLAIQDFDKVIELNNPDLAFVYNCRGNSYFYLEQYWRASQDYTKVIQLNPNDATGYSNRGLAYKNLKKYNLAIKDLNKSIELNPNDGKSYFVRGTCYYELLGDEAKSRADFAKAIQLGYYE